MKRFSLCFLMLCCVAFAQEWTMLFDFRGGQLNGWKGNFDVKSLTATAEGLHAVSSGGIDPWIEGPVIPKLPAPGNYDKIVLEVYVKATGGSLECFFGPTFTAPNAVNIMIPKRREWCLASVIMKPLKEGYRLRLDPPGGPGETTVGFIRVRPWSSKYLPEFPRPEAVELVAGAKALSSGKLMIRHNPGQWDGFVFEVDGKPFGSSHSRPQLVTLVDGKANVMELKDAKTTVETSAGQLDVTSTFVDADGATWIATRQFKAAKGDCMTVTTSFVCDRDRQVLHVPWLTLFPGYGAFGGSKTQAMLAGVEYLVDEPSSDTKDVIVPSKANRIMVDDYKLCFPLMAISHGRRWLSLDWEYDKFPATVFDTPDRLFKTGSHLFALWSPGTREERLENDFNVYDPITWKAGERKSLTATLTCGSDDGTMASAIDQYTKRNPLPPVPEFENGFQGALELAAQGWLDSAILEDGKWRHAWVPGTGFGAVKAYDAIVMLDYIATKTKDKALATRAKKAVEEFLPQFGGSVWGGVVTHDFNNLFSFLYGCQTSRWLNEVIPGARESMAKNFREDGSYKYVASPPPQKDYGITHWADHANGLTATRLKHASRMAMATGNKQYRDEYVKLVDKMLELYRGDVPRGAQTWEIPLHTPDILASAYFVTHCTYAYRITGKKSYLDEAEYWALTGIPFVYLVHPVSHLNPDGVYATIAVFGATGWTSPMWVGLPVQWCGAVYRNALYEYIDDLDNAERKAFWKRIADGITLAGLQFSYQERDNDSPDMFGLLPDAYFLKSRGKGAPSINPGTIMNTMPEAYGETPIGYVRAVGNGVFVHALGEIKPNGAKSISLNLWPAKPTEVLVSGIQDEPVTVTWQGKEIPVVWNEEHKAMIATLQGKGQLKW